MSPKRFTALGPVLVLAGAAAPALAVPSFARQTGMTCAACHTMIPELTPFGREFKLNGYTLDNLRQIEGRTMERRETLALNALPPLSVMAQVSYTRTAQPLPDSAATGALAKDGEVLFPQQVSLFYAGKIANDLGAFMQLTYDGAADHFGLDNTDIRYARYIGLAEPEGSGDAAHRGFLQRHDILVGLSLNNNPTVQDPWNSTPAWGFPYAGSSVAPEPNASARLDTGAGAIGQDAAGLGAYLWFDHALYAELSFYTAAKTGGAHPLDSTQPAVLRGVAPYWRVGYEYRWDRNSLFVGTYGMQVSILPGAGHPLNGPSDHYTDVAADAEYQFIGEDHLVTVLASFIHENQHLDASYAYGTAGNSTNDLHTLKATAEYSYRRLIGGAASVFSTAGSADPQLYADDGTVDGSLAGTPDSRGYVLELDYLPFLNTKLMLQYVGYTRFNGASADYAGTGRSASANDTLYLLVWLNF
ncbi:MAG: cytochrome C [Steroidobacteraceae bacterium]